MSLQANLGADFNSAQGCKESNCPFNHIALHGYLSPLIDIYIEQ